VILIAIRLTAFGDRGAIAFLRIFCSDSSQLEIKLESIADDSRPAALITARLLINPRSNVRRQQYRQIFFGHAQPSTVVGRRWQRLTVVPVDFQAKFDGLAGIAPRFIEGRAERYDFRKGSASHRVAAFRFGPKAAEIPGLEGVDRLASAHPADIAWRA
jgi:hypothetical protein